MGHLVRAGLRAGQSYLTKSLALSKCSDTLSKHRQEIVKIGLNVLSFLLIIYSNSSIIQVENEIECRNY